MSAHIHIVSPESQNSQIGITTTSWDKIGEELPPLESPLSMAPPPRDCKFWMIILAICMSLSGSALEVTAVSTALPVIASELQGADFVWVGSAYTLASTACLPMSGGLAQVFGRRIIMLTSLFFFLLGSILCGCAQSMNWLIAGRAIQGTGSGGITALTSIILSDLVPLRTRGTFNGLIGLTWSLMTCLGPIVGGALAEHNHWRWIFYLNIFIIAAAAVLVVCSMNLKTPPGTVREKLARMDWTGNYIVVPATTSTVIALTWGGIQYPWSSPRVLVPLCLGLAGFGSFLFYEVQYAENPIVPFTLLSQRTTISGYLQTFILPIIILAYAYYLTAYFQACKGASPITAGVWGFAMGLTMAPLSIVGGLSVTLSKRYRPQLWLGWALLVVGCGLMSRLTATTPLGYVIGYEVLVGVAIGLIVSTTYFPVLAPMPVRSNALALSFFAFARSFGQVWGVTIGGTVLQNELLKRLPADFVQSFPQGAEIAYAVIPQIAEMQPELREQVRDAFAGSFAVLWRMLIGIAGLGFLDEHRARVC